MVQTEREYAEALFSLAALSERYLKNVTLKKFKTLEFYKKMSEFCTHFLFVTNQS